MTAADMTKLAGIYFYEWILESNLWGDVLICAFVHDEIVTEGPKEIIDKVENKLKQCMEKAGQVFCPTVPIIVKTETGKLWNH